MVDLCRAKAAQKTVTRSKKENDFRKFEEMARSNEDIFCRDRQLSVRPCKRLLHSNEQTFTS